MIAKICITILYNFGTAMLPCSYDCITLQYVKSSMIWAACTYVCTYTSCTCVRTYICTNFIHTYLQYIYTYILTYTYCTCIQFCTYKINAIHKLLVLIYVCYSIPVFPLSLLSSSSIYCDGLHILAH